MKEPNKKQMVVTDVVFYGGTANPPQLEIQLKEGDRQFRVASHIVGESTVESVGQMLSELARKLHWGEFTEVEVSEPIPDEAWREVEEKTGMGRQEAVKAVLHVESSEADKALFP